MATKYRVVHTDNFGRSGEGPGYDERFISGPIAKEDADVLARLENSRCNVNGPDYYKVVPETYKLVTFQL